MVTMGRCDGDHHHTYPWWSMWSPSCIAPYSSSSMCKGEGSVYKLVPLGGGVSVRAGAIRGRGQCISWCLGGGGGGESEKIE